MTFTQQARSLAGLGAVIGLVIAAGSAFADEPASSQEPTSTVSGPSILLGAAAPVSDETLGTESAKAQIQLDKLVVNEQDLDGVVQDNVAINNTTGNNSVSGEAFSDAAGFVTVIQNTGNNVLIQNSTIVNIALEP